MSPHLDGILDYTLCGHTWSIVCTRVVVGICTISIHAPYCLASRTLLYSLSAQKLQCSPTSDGAAAAVVASEEFVKAHGLQDKGILLSCVA